ncbi:hypothetical protein DSCW_43880 [Desulfosarcina widdelii]|uniref:Uncharacterized protein n=1 Tax=Desulfosarcina widdelii TaxID=947919 RepID=A0A5K7ZB83_9BACT|nr:hypothetical protein [Desulfosarcina widdelii]BBO76971.1 hypothetical protein DSCW_43880 [Desulfosarcina widdelii]
MKKIRCKSGIGWLPSIGMIAVVAIATTAMISQDNNMYAMNSAHQTNDKTISAIPAIDAELPDAFETASFGLG